MTVAELISLLQARDSTAVVVAMHGIEVVPLKSSDVREIFIKFERATYSAIVVYAYNKNEEPIFVATPISVEEATDELLT